MKNREMLETKSNTFQDGYARWDSLYVACSPTGSAFHLVITVVPYRTSQSILWPCWTEFFGHARWLLKSMSSWASIAVGRVIFNRPNRRVGVFGGRVWFPYIVRW